VDFRAIVISGGKIVLLGARQFVVAARHAHCMIAEHALNAATPARSFIMSIAISKAMSNAPQRLPAFSVR
jgi:hypothetical protein